MCDNDNPAVVLNFILGKIIISSKSNDNVCGEMMDEISSDYTGEEIKIIFNIKFLSSAVKMIDEKELYLGIKNPTKPAFVQGVKNDSYFSLIMPIKG